MSTRCDTSHLPWHLEFRLSMGSCGCSTQIRSRSCFSTLDIVIPGDDLRAERFNSAIVADKLSRLSVVRKANGTTFSAEICLPFEPSKVFFLFWWRKFEQKDKNLFHSHVVDKLLLPSVRWRRVRGLRYSEANKLNSSSSPPQLKFSCNVNKQKRKGGKNLSQLYHHHHNVVVVMFYVFAVHKKNLCFLWLTEVTKRNSRVQLSYFLLAVPVQLALRQTSFPQDTAVCIVGAVVNCNQIYPSLHVDAACSCFRTESQW